MQAMCLIARTVQVPRSLADQASGKAGTMLQSMVDSFMLRKTDRCPNNRREEPDACLQRGALTTNAILAGVHAGGCCCITGGRGAGDRCHTGSCCRSHAGVCCCIHAGVCWCIHAGVCCCIHAGVCNCIHAGVCWCIPAGGWFCFNGVCCPCIHAGVCN